MDWLTGLTKIVEATAWPIVVLTCFVLSRSQLPILVKSLRKLKLRDLELEFHEGAKQVAIEAARSLPMEIANSEKAGLPQDDLIAKLIAIGELSQSAAIGEAWWHVEMAAIRAVGAYQNDTDRQFRPYELRRVLDVKKVLNPEQLAVFDQLRKLRNAAVHEEQFAATPADIENYVKAAVKLKTFLENEAVLQSAR